MNNLILFDVDGTLTEARSGISTKMLRALRELCRYAEVGFLTGSSLEYIKEQLWPALNDPIIKHNCHLLPCNGTEYLITDGDEEIIFNTISRSIMEDELGYGATQRLFQILCAFQAEIIQEYSFPLAGDFVQNRISMINWCPIGRASDREARKAFKIIDQNNNIRAKYIKKLENIVKDEKIGVTVKLGGDTSFDIFPTGWDKTFALNHFDKNSWNFWFVGDRCYPQGNDYEIFSFLKDSGCAYETSGPEETLEIIDFHILREFQ